MHLSRSFALAFPSCLACVFPPSYVSANAPTKQLKNRSRDEFVVEKWWYVTAANRRAYIFPIKTLPAYASAAWSGFLSDFEWDVEIAQVHIACAERFSDRIFEPDARCSSNLLRLPRARARARSNHVQKFGEKRLMIARERSDACVRARSMTTR
eukprot:7383083-Prymnesium_polylepis.1